MKLTQLTLENFRGFKKLELMLDPQLTVIVGANGAGKSSVLDAIAILLSRITSRVRGGAGRRDIRELDIHNKSSYALIKAHAVDENAMDIDWQALKVKSGHLRPEITKDNDSLSHYVKTIQKKITENTEAINNNDFHLINENSSIPTFAYYPINRAVLDIPLRIRKKHAFSQLDAWDGALTSASNFRHFFEWFREREDFENEKKIHANNNNKDYQIEAVRLTLKKFLPEFSKISIRRNPLRMITQKNGKEIRIDQLSDGEKNIIALIGDIVRRLSIANEHAQWLDYFFNILNDSSASNSESLNTDSQGIILIDEIDLHLHPAWQRMVLPRLMATFPQCQFIVSTHSPQILGEIEAHQIRILSQDENNEIHCHIPQQAKGLTSNEVLNELMSWDGSNLARNAEVEKQLDTLFKLIDDEDFVQAKAQIAQMKTALHGSLPDIVQAEALMSMMEADLVDDTQ